MDCSLPPTGVGFSRLPQRTRAFDIHPGDHCSWWLTLARPDFLGRVDRGVDCAWLRTTSTEIAQARMFPSPKEAALHPPTRRSSAWASRSRLFRAPALPAPEARIPGATRPDPTSDRGLDAQRRWIRVRADAGRVVVLALCRFSNVGRGLGAIP